VYLYYLIIGPLHYIEYYIIIIPLIIHRRYKIHDILHFVKTILFEKLKKILGSGKPKIIGLIII